jgi:hypothetical protein
MSAATNSVAFEATAVNKFPIPIQEIDSMTKQPTTLLEILENMRLVLDQDLLLREDFYTDDTLLLFSGGSQVQWGERSSTKQWAAISGFGKIAEPARVKDFSYEWISYRAGRTIRDSGEIDGMLTLHLTKSDPSVIFEAIVRIFGPGWQPDSSSNIPLPSPRVFQPITHPHGNARITYTSRSGDVNRSISMEFHADGTLENATFEEETK